MCLQILEKPRTEDYKLFKLQLTRLVHVDVVHDGGELLSRHPHPHHPQDGPRGLRADGALLVAVKGVKRLPEL